VQVDKDFPRPGYKVYTQNNGREVFHVMLNEVRSSARQRRWGRECARRAFVVCRWI
jgi:hypothetical protein